MSTHNDRFHGLLTNPPGEWGLLAYSNDHALILKGSDLFKERALNLLCSFVGGFRNQFGDEVIDGSIEHQAVAGCINNRARTLHIKEKDMDGTLMIPISSRKLCEGLKLWFYGQIFQQRAEIREILDNEGDVRDIHVLNHKDMLREAGDLTQSFYAHIHRTRLGTHFRYQWGRPGHHIEHASVHS